MSAPEDNAGSRGLKPSTFVKAAVVIAVSALLIVLLAYDRGGLIYSTQQYVDIESGRIREVQRVFGLQVVEVDRVSSLAIATGHLGTSARPDWQQTHSTTLFNHTSPHYAYHSAINQIRQLELLNDLVPFTRAGSEQAGQEILRRWHEGSDDSAETYLEELGEIVIQRHAAGATYINYDDLP